MGQGGYLLLKNKTPYKWKRTHINSYQMKSWDRAFPEYIIPNSFAKVYIEWTEGTKNKKDDAGEVNYTMEGPNATFQIQARAKNGFEIKIVCINFSTNQIRKGEAISLGWAHNNTLIFTIAGSLGKFISLGSGQNPSNWMSHIEDTRKISDLTIPGTHDSCAYDVSIINYGYLSYLLTVIPSIDPFSIFLKAIIALGAPIAVETAKKFTQCQKIDLRTQLDKGIRFLDIRVKKENDELQLYHGAIKLPFTFSQIMQICYDFLKTNKEETIIASIKNEGHGNKPIDLLVKKETDNHKEMWYVSNAIPILKSVRGKLVLLRRYATSEPIGIDAAGVWPDNTQKDDLKNTDGQLFAIQDEYSNYILRELDHKFKNHVQPYLEKASKSSADRLFINFTSGSGTTGGFVFPKTLAKGEESISTFKGTNQLVLDYLKDKINNMYGIIPMDFPEYPNNSLIPLLISTNNYSTVTAVSNHPELNGKRINDNNTGKVYLVIDGNRHHIPNSVVADALFGKEWGITNHINPNIIADGNPLNDAYIMKFNNDSKVYLCFKDPSETKPVIRHIPTMKILQEYGFNGEIKIEKQDDINLFNIKAPLPEPKE